MGFEYRTLNKPFVSILGLVIKKLIRKKPPNNTNTIMRGKFRPISENDNKNKNIVVSINLNNSFNIKRFLKKNSKCKILKYNL